MLAFRAGRSVPQLLTCGNVRSLVPSYEQVLDQSNGEAHDAGQSSKTFTDSNRCFQDQPTSALSRRLCHKIHVRIPRMRAGHLHMFASCKPATVDTRVRNSTPVPQARSEMCSIGLTAINSECIESHAVCTQLIGVDQSVIKFATVIEGVVENENVRVP